MNLKALRAAAFKAAQDIINAAKAANRDLTDTEQAEVTAKIAEVKELDTKIEAAKKSAELITSLGELGGSNETDEDEADSKKAGGAKTSPVGVHFGQMFVESEAYKSFAKAHPSGVSGQMPINISAKIGGLREVYYGTKSDPAPLALPSAHVAPVRFPTVDLTYPPQLTLLDLITKGETAGAFEYLQITSVTNNAEIVAEAATATGTDAAGGLKPLSTLGTNLADAKVFAYADGMTVTNAMLADAPALASYLQSRFGYNINTVIAGMLLNGSGDSGEPLGILASEGLQHQSFDTDMFRSIRKAITKVTRIGGTVTAVLLSPEDDEEWDLAQDGNDRYYGQGPFGSGPGTAWGRPRVVSEQLQPGTALLGDFKTVALLDREGLSVTAFNQHADYARRNLTYIRAELRAAQCVFEPAKLVEVATAVGGGDNS